MVTGRTTFLKGAKLAALLVAMVTAGSAYADLIWNWQLGTESGTFITEGTLADVTSGGDFPITDFEVTVSAYPDNAGSGYYELQPGQGFLWDGSAATQFYRDAGTLTNGSNFYLTVNDWRYTFFPGGGFVENADENLRYEAQLTLTPVGEFTAPIPSLTTWGILFMAVLLGSIGLARRRPVRARLR